MSSSSLCASIEALHSASLCFSMIDTSAHRFRVDGVSSLALPSLWIGLTYWDGWFFIIESEASAGVRGVYIIAAERTSARRERRRLTLRDLWRLSSGCGRTRLPAKLQVHVQPQRARILFLNNFERKSMSRQALNFKFFGRLEGLFVKTTSTLVGVRNWGKKFTTLKH